MLVFCLGGCLAAVTFAGPPKLTYLYPSGAQRGTSVVVTGAGEFSSWPVEVWCDMPGVKIVAEKESAKFSVTIANDAPPGVCWWRAYNAEGASALRPFLIDQLAEVAESEPNDSTDKAPLVSLPVIVNGKLNKNGDLDGYQVKLTAGQTLVASLQANWQLGSPMDSVLQVCELVTRQPSSVVDLEPRVEAYVLSQDHDTRGLDPLLSFTAPREGVYLIRIFAFPSEPGASIAYSGGDSYVYRLTLTTAGLVEFPFPLSAPREASEVQLVGWNLADGRFPLAALANDSPEVSRLFAAGSAGALDVPRVEIPVRMAGPEANGDAGEAITLPSLISGRLEKPQATQSFRFAAKKGEKLKLEVTAREWGLPLDGVLTIHSAHGEQLQSVDDAQKQTDPELVFNAPADGEYRVRVRDLHERGGARYAYQLLVAPVKPDYSLSLASDALIVAPNKPLEVPVTIDRREGFAGEITISAVGLPPGVVADAVASKPAGDSAKTVKLVLKTTGETKAWQGPITITGSSAGDKPRTATFSVNLPGVRRMSAAWLTVTDK